MNDVMNNSGTSNNTGAQKNSFLFGLAIGIAIISTLALITLLIYMFTHNSFAGTGNTNNAKASQYEQCLNSTDFDKKIEDSIASGSALGVKGTPAVFINGYLIAGAYPVDYFKQVIDDLLAGKTPAQEFLKDESGKITKEEIQVTADDHVQGSTDAKITLVEYSDFECPYCARVVPTLDQLLKDYQGNIRLVFRHFPLSFHQYSKKGAIAAECANKQGKFWEMYAKLFAYNTAGTFTLDNIIKAGTDIGLK